MGRRRRVCGRGRRHAARETSTGRVPRSALFLTSHSHSRGCTDSVPHYTPKLETDRKRRREKPFQKERHGTSQFLVLAEGRNNGVVANCSPQRRQRLLCPPRLLCAPRARCWSFCVCQVSRARTLIRWVLFWEKGESARNENAWRLTKTRLNGKNLTFALFLFPSFPPGNTPRQPRLRRQQRSPPLPRRQWRQHQ